MKVHVTSEPIDIERFEELVEVRQEVERERRVKLLKREWSAASIANTRAALSYAAAGRFVLALHHSRVAAECAHMALNAPCELRPFLQDVMDAEQLSVGDD